MNTMNLGCCFFVILVVLATCNSYPTERKISDGKRKIAEAIVKKERESSGNQKVKLWKILKSSSQKLAGVTGWYMKIAVSYGRNVKGTCIGIVIDGVRIQPRVMYHKCSKVQKRDDLDEDEEDENQEEEYVRLYSGHDLGIEY